MTRQELTISYILYMST